MCLVMSIMANLCPIMIHFCALDFNVCRSEEVKFLLTLTVDFILFFSSVYNMGQSMGLGQKHSNVHVMYMYMYI